jgi:hypothetical protein
MQFLASVLMSLIALKTAKVSVDVGMSNLENQEAYV